MDIFLVVIFYSLMGNGEIKTSTAEYIAPSYEVCETVAIVVKGDPELNTPTDYVHSAECELRIKPVNRSKHEH